MRLIDADAFERAVMFSDDEDLQDVIYRLRDYPSIDLVRCGECKRRKKNKFCLEHGRYEKNDDGFCSYGERKDEPSADKSSAVETMSCQECKHFHENAVMYLDQCDFCFKDCKYEPKTEPQTDEEQFCRDHKCTFYRPQEGGCTKNTGDCPFTDEPQTETHDKNTKTHECVKDEPQTEGRECDD